MRAKIIWTVLAVIVGLVAWALLTPPAEPGRVGFNRLVENAVTTAPAGQSDFQPSVAGADVNFGDRVATAAASRLEVSLLDRSLLTVGANARLEIDRFVYDPERNVAGVAVSVLRGAFRFASDNRGAQPEPIAFRTPGSAIGIRGTRIEGVVGPEAVAFLAGIPGAPDLSAEADSAAVLILREGAIGVAVNGQSVVLDRPVRMVALTRTRLYPPFAVSDEATRRFELLLPSRTGLVAPPAALPPGRPPVAGPVPVDPAPPVRPSDPAAPAPTPATDKPATAAPPARDPPVRQPPVREPAVRQPPVREPAVVPPPNRAPPPAVTAPPTKAPPASAPPARDPPVQRIPRPPATTTAPPTQVAPTEPRLRRPVRPPAQSEPQPGVAPRPQ